LTQASRAATFHATSIQSDLIYLREKVASYGNAIINRRKKKRPEQRRAVLLQAFPKISEKQWILIHAKYDYPGWRETRHLREGLLLPYISLEVLMKDPFKFFALLHARTEFGPEEWVAFDKNQTNLGWYEGRFQVDYANCAVVLYGPRYGGVVSWDMNKAHRWDICAFPRAKLILEAQSTVMGFLRKAVENILEGANPSGEGASTKWTELAQSGFRRYTGVETWSLFSNQAYAKPTFEFDRLLDIAKSRLAEANDHLWLLQTDAAYFQYHIKQSSQGYMFKGSQFGNAKNDQHRFLASRMWSYPILATQKWTWIVQEMEHTMSIYDKYRDSIALGYPLPPEFDFAMACLELRLVNMIQISRSVLREALPQFIAFQHHFTFDHTVSGQIRVSSGTGLVGNHDHDCKQFFTKDPLFWCLHTLLDHNFETDDLANPGMLFGFLENWMEQETTSSKDKLRLEQRLFDDLSSLAANHEILAAVRQFRPICTYTDAMTAKQRCSDHMAWRTMHTVGEDLSYRQTPQEKVIEAFKLFDATPFPRGNRNAEWLQRADNVRKLSENFWKSARAEQWKHLATSSFARCTKADKEWLQSLLSFDSTPEHQAFLQSEREAILSPKTSSKPVDLQLGPIPEWPATVSSRNSSTVFPARPKDKIKTRPDGVNRMTLFPDEPKCCIVEEPPSTPTLLVKSETIRVLSRMFPCTYEEHLAKAIDWRSFVTAICDAGFSVSSPGGSAYTFVKVGEGRIVFHKPHDNKIDPIDFQGWGKRMNRRFGWERDMFVDVKTAGAS
jgi:hypothetical protein